MILIIGAGLSGLTVANRLAHTRDILVLEKNDHPGGLSTSFYVDGFRFDYGGHYFHYDAHTRSVVKPYVEQFGSFLEFERKSKTFLLRRYIPFPIQFHLAYLPFSLRKKIYQEMMETSEISSANLAKYLDTHFGPTLVDLFFKPFLTKYYHTDLNALASNMDKGSIPIPDRAQVTAGYAGKRRIRAGYNPVLYYPKPSLKEWIDSYAKPVANRIRFNESVVSIDTEQRKVTTTEGSYAYDQLVTSMPLNTLLGILKPHGRFPSPHGLHCMSTLVVNVVLGRRNKRFHWVYLSEKTFPFYRVGLYAGQPFGVCYMERNLRPGSIPNSKKLHEDICYTLKELQLITDPKEITHVEQRLIPAAYVVFDHRWETIVPAVLHQLKTHGIHSIGRYGAWNYSSMSQDIAQALQCAEEIKVR
ncbi:MAG: protoporphyrinogen/coproporphyrinogen oxidase [Candidatus Omnitrophota bacterium]